MPLTVTTIKALQPTSKTQKHYDGHGMYLEVTPKGSKRWRLRYRFNGKEKTISLGLYPTVSLKDARAKRDDARQLLSKGINPSEQRKAEKAAAIAETEHTFEAIAREWHAKKATAWADTYSGRVLSRLERDIFPWVGGKPIEQIEAPELLQSIQRIEQRNAVESAHRTLRICGQVFRYAIASGRASRDPSSDLRGALSPVKKGHMAAITDPRKLAGLLRAIDTFDGSLIVKTALQLAPMLFVRPGELRQMKWEDLDSDRSEWRYLVSKTETEHIVPLAHQVGQLLCNIEPLTGEGSFVFPNARTKKKPMSDVAMLAALRRMGFGKGEMSVHGFRAVARTLLDEELSFRVDYIEHQLAHTVRDTNGRAYNRTKFLIERKHMMQVWADYLEQLKKPSDVAPIGTASRSHDEN